MAHGSEKRKTAIGVGLALAAWAVMGAETTLAYKEGSKMPGTRITRLEVSSGMSDKAVRTLQEELKMLGYLGKVDGSFGPLTRNALRAFQEAHGLVGTGEPDPFTRSRITAELKKEMNRQK